MAESLRNLHTLALIAEFNRLAATHDKATTQEEHDLYWQVRKELESRVLPSGSLSPVYAGKHRICPDPDGRCMFGDDQNCPALLLSFARFTYWLYANLTRLRPQP